MNHVSANQRAARHSRKFRPQLELLEPRHLCATTVLSLNAGVAVRDVNPEFFGINTPSWDYYLSQSHDGQGTTPDAKTMNFLRSAGVGSVRASNGEGNDGYISGGTQKQGWHWYLPGGGPDSVGPVGPGLLANLIDSVHAEGVINVNYGTGTAHEAAAYVAYLNGDVNNTFSIGADVNHLNWGSVSYWAGLRAAAPLAVDDGYNFLRINHAAPLGFKYFEIGNEAYYGVWNGGTPSVADYVGFAKTFETLTDNIDPAISIGVGVGPAVDWDQPWNIPLLQQCAAQNFVPGFLSDHFYIYNGGIETVSDANLLLNTVNKPGSKDPFQTPRNWADRFRAYDLLAQTYLNKRLGRDPGEVEILATEFNTDAAAANKQSVSLVRGLNLADALGSALKTEYSTVMYWDLRNGASASPNSAPKNRGLYGWRQIRDQGFLGSGSPASAPATGAYTPYPQFFAAQLAAKLIRPGATVLKTASNNALVSFYAVRQANGHVTVLAINKSPTAASTAKVSLTGFSAASQATAFRYGVAEDLAQRDSSTGAAKLTSTRPVFAVTRTAAGSTFNVTLGKYSMTVIDLVPTAAKSVQRSAANIGSEAPSANSDLSVYSQAPARSSFSSAGRLETPDAFRNAPNSSFETFASVDVSRPTLEVAKSAPESKTGELADILFQDYGTEPATSSIRQRQTSRSAATR